MCFEIEIQKTTIKDRCDLGHSSVGKVHINCDGTGQSHSWHCDGSFENLLYCPFCGIQLRLVNPIGWDDKDANPQ